MATNDFTPAAEAVQQSVDSVITEEARSLAAKCIKVANYYLDNGSPQMQLSVIRAIMPAIAKGMSTKGETDEMADLRKELQELQQAFLGDTSAA